MSHHRKLLWNTVANTAGQLLGPVVAIILVPVYLSVLGRESYGLIGFFTALNLLMQIFSQGIGQALQRSIAQRDVDEQGRRLLRRLVSTFERAYGVMGLVIMVCLMAASGFVSRDWVRNEHLDSSTIQLCLVILSLRIGIAFPSGVYQSVFVGTQRQVIGNATTVIVTLAGALANVAITFLTRSVVWVIACDAMFAALTMVLLRWQAFRVLPQRSASESGTFSRQDFLAVARPSIWLICTSGLGVLITQMDRIILSRMVTLGELAVYNAGVAAGRVVSILYTPFLMASYPEICQCATQGDRKALARLVARNATVVSAMTACCAFPMCFFASDVLQVWTRDATVVHEGSAILVLYTLGSLAISNASVFYMLQMAIGAVRYAAAFNAVSILWYPLGMIGLIHVRGPEGAAWCWLVYCASAWIAVGGVAFLRHLDRGMIGAYLQAAALPVLLGTCISAVMSKAAHMVFPLQAWPRLAFAATAAAAILPASVVAVLGPTDSMALFRRMVRRT